MHSIKFVYFDVGGVLVLDYSGTNKWTEMKRDLGITVEKDAMFEEIWNKYKSRVSIDYDVDKIIPELQEMLDISVPDDYSMLHDFVTRFTTNPSIWPVVFSIKKKYKVGLLTNMYPRMLSSIMDQKLLDEYLWDVIVDSSVVGFQKPDEAIFKLAESMAHLSPAELFFVDNSQKNIDAANRRGWKTMFYDSKNPEKSNEELEKMLELK